MLRTSRAHCNISRKTRKSTLDTKFYSMVLAIECLLGLENALTDRVRVTVFSKG